MSKPHPRIRSTLKVGRSVAGQVVRGAAGVAGHMAGAVVGRIPRRRTPMAPAPPLAPPAPERAATPSQPTPAPVESTPPVPPEPPVTPATVAKNVAPKPQTKKKPAKKSSPSAKLPPRRKQAEEGPGRAAPKKAAATKAGTSAPR